MRMYRARYDDAVLPRDLIVEILSWLPVKLLLRFRCVCKSWKSLILDPSFVKLHLQRSSCRDTNILFTFLDPNLVQHQQRSLHYCSMERLLDDPLATIDDDVFPLKRKYHVIGVCNGLVCLSAKTREDSTTTCSVRFYNPATRLRSKKSPPIKIGSKNVMGFGYDDSSDTYKVVAIRNFMSSKSKTELRVHCMGDNCWKNIASWTGFPRILRNRGRFVSNTLNWIAKLSSTNKYAVFSFDIRKETYRYLSLPVDVDVAFDVPKIGDYRGCLCLSHNYKGTHLAVWQMKEFGVQKSWTLLNKVSYEHLQISPWMSMYANHEVMLMGHKSELELVLYNGRDDKVKPIMLVANISAWEHALLLLCNVRSNGVESLGLSSKIVFLESTNYVQSLVLPYHYHV